MKDLIIIKLGGSIITNKQSKTPQINSENINLISKEIASIYNPKKMSLIIIHGAGSYGHNIVKKTGIHKGIEKKRQLIDFAQTQKLQNELNCIIAENLIKQKLPTIPCQASSFAIMEDGKLTEMDISAIKGFLEIGLIPLLYGVPAYDKIQKCSILSGDQIAPFLAIKLKAKKIISITNTDGVFDSDPFENPNAKIIPEINTKNINNIRFNLKELKVTDVTGGMLNKVINLVGKGITSQIINIKPYGNLTKAINGENIGTIII